MDMANIVEAYVASVLDTAQKVFVDDPSAAHWDACLGAMLTYQQWRRMTDEQRTACAKLMGPHPIVEWQDRLIAYASGGQFPTVEAALLWMWKGV